MQQCAAQTIVWSIKQLAMILKYACIYIYMQGRIQGEGTGGQFPPPPQLWTFHSTQLIHKLQHFIVYTTSSFIKHTKLCLKVQIFVETEHFAARKQAIAANRRRGLSILGAWPKILRARVARVFIVPPPPQILDPSLYLNIISLSCGLFHWTHTIQTSRHWTWQIKLYAIINHK